MFTYDGRAPIKENNEIMYVIVVNGQQMTQPNTRSLTEQQLHLLNEDQQKVAQIIPVTSKGKQVLMEN